MAMPPVCLCQPTGPAVAMRCLKNGVHVIHDCEIPHPNKTQYSGDAWQCPHCKSVIVLCGNGTGTTGYEVENVGEDVLVVGSRELEVEKLKVTYDAPPWIGE